MLWLVLMLAHADTGDACLEPLTLRSMRPDFEATGVPTNARITVSLIGGGEPEDFHLQLHGASGLVESTQESWCYAHESDFERHCTLVLTPLTDLEADTLHTVFLDPSDRHPEPAPGRFRSSFQTGASRLVQTLQAPELQHLGMRPRPEEDIEPCEWTEAEQADFMVFPAAMEGGGMATVEIIETLDDGSAASVHTLFPATMGDDGLDFRQVLEPGDVRARCYEAITVDAAGAVSPPSAPACIHGEGTDEDPRDTAADSGQRDTSSDDGVDTAPAEPVDTGPLTADSSDPAWEDAEPQPVQSAGKEGCGRGAAGLLVWTWLFSMAGRRRGDRTASPPQGPSRMGG